jgi:hypothetical protein
VKATRRRAGRVVQRAQHPFPDPKPPDVGAALRSNRDECHEHSHEAHAVQKEGQRHSERGDEQAGDGGADDARAVHDHRVERDGVGQIGPADEVRDV